MVMRAWGLSPQRSWAAGGVLVGTALAPGVHRLHTGITGGAERWPDAQALPGFRSPEPLGMGPGIRTGAATEGPRVPQGRDTLLGGCMCGGVLGSRGVPIVRAAPGGQV